MEYYKEDGRNSQKYELQPVTSRYLIYCLVKVAKSAEKGARKSAQMGATWIINSSVYYDAVNKLLLPHP